MNILIIGSGGREHAIADAFARSPQIHKLVVSPGNPGIAMKHNVKKLNSFVEIKQFCRENLIDYVFIGGEQPVADGLTDWLRNENIRVIGPSEAAGRIETSKAFAKDLMIRYNIPTAKFEYVKDMAQARKVIADYGFPIVLKADGLAAGKGVFIAEDLLEAEEALKQLESSITDQGVIIEEFLIGWELSLFAISDGYNYRTTVFSQDHKQLYDNDTGPNTGGMGAFAPVEEGEQYREEIEASIVSPILKAMREEGCPFTGILYCGLMITKDGPKVLEFNCRLGDPETEAVLPLLKTDLIDICRAIDQQKVDELVLDWEDKTAITVVLASAGYPGSLDTGYPISIDNDLKSTVFYAGVMHSANGLANSGGRVMMVTAVASDIMEARSIVYEDIRKISFEGKYYRSDIGLRSNTII